MTFNFPPFFIHIFSIYADITVSNHFVGAFPRTFYYDVSFWWSQIRDSMFH